MGLLKLLLEPPGNIILTKSTASNIQNTLISNFPNGLHRRSHVMESEAYLQPMKSLFNAMSKLGGHGTENRLIGNSTTPL